MATEAPLDRLLNRCIVAVIRAPIGIHEIVQICLGRSIVIIVVGVPLGKFDSGFMWGGLCTHHAAWVAGMRFASGTFNFGGTL